MKNLALGLFLVGITMHFSAGAAFISAQQAQAVAVNFIRLNANSGLSKTEITATLNYTRSEKDGSPDYYIFNLQPVAGFVIVSANDNTEPVLAWSTESNFILGGSYVGIKDWMDKTAARITTIKKLGLLADEHIMQLWNAYENGHEPGLEKATAVGPLMTTTWNQQNGVSNPPPYLYNQFCPFNSTDNERCVTGCVACAMAQIMKYWSYPITGKGSYKYVDAPPTYSHNYGSLFANFGNTTYQWAEMPDALTNNTTATQDSAVGLLMYHAGVAVSMNYNDIKHGGSSAYVLYAGPFQPSAQVAYTTYFGFDTADIHGVSEKDYTNASWMALIQSELNAGRVVQYMGVDSGVGGHSWVCDGYSANNMFHMNWGWGGACNGNFSLSNLNPATYAFNSSDAALIGIHPPAGAQTGRVSGINQVAAADSPIKDISIYPNPARNYLVLQYTAETETSVKENIYNLAGQKVISHETTSIHGTNLQSFNTEMLANGYYILEIETNGMIQKRKFVVSK
jgi:Peptidase C10 family/Spi protease inhibitor/Secretion system C-terminal sorting domain